jgi:hypothetical protein
MYNCEKCKYQTLKKDSWDKHIKSKKHNSEKKEYVCSKCNYFAKTSQLYKQHLETEKHKGNETNKIIEGNETNKIIEGNETNKTIEGLISLIKILVEKQVQTNEKLLEIIKHHIIIKDKDVWNDMCFDEKIKYSIDFISLRITTLYNKWKNKNIEWNVDTHTDLFDKSMKIMDEIYSVDKIPSVSKKIKNEYVAVTIKKI